MTDKTDTTSTPTPGVAPQESFGDYLKKQREASGKTIQEISATTKISSRYLEAFESNDTDRFPAKTFARGFLKNYAEEVGIDVDECMERFDQFQRSLMPTQIKEIRKSSESSSRMQPDEKTAQLNITLLVAGVVGILLIGLTLTFLMDSTDRADLEEVATTTDAMQESLQPEFPEDPVKEESLAEPVEAKPTTEAPASAAPSESQEESMAVPVTPSILEVEALEETSLKIRLDEGVSQTIRLAPGDRKTFSVEREVEIRNIKRGSIRFFYNGKPLEVAGQMIKLFNRNLFNQNN